MFSLLLFLLPLLLFTKRECHLPFNLSSFQQIPIFLLVFAFSQLFFFCLSSLLRYPKVKVLNSSDACCWFKRFVLLETRGLSPESDGQLPRKLKGQRSGLHLILSYILTQGSFIQLGSDVHFRDN